MESTEAHKKALGIFSDLWHQYSHVCKIPESKTKVKKDIEEQFDNLIRAIIARKQELFDVIDAHFSGNEKDKAWLKAASEGCHKLVDAGATIFPYQPEVAVAMWNCAGLLEQPKSDPVGVKLEFDQASMYDSISAFGKLTNVSTDLEVNAESLVQKSINGAFTNIQALSTMCGDFILTKDERKAGDVVKSKGWIRAKASSFCPDDNCCYIVVNKDTIMRIPSQGEMSIFVSFPTTTLSEIAYYQKEKLFIAFFDGKIHTIDMLGEKRIIAEVGDYPFSPSTSLIINEENGDIFLESPNHHTLKIMQQGNGKYMVSSL